MAYGSFGTSRADKLFDNPALSWRQEGIAGERLVRTRIFALCTSCCIFPAKGTFEKMVRLVSAGVFFIRVIGQEAFKQGCPFREGIRIL
jgi:hypothetical protein